jgi:hypothetical protein
MDFTKNDMPNNSIVVCIHWYGNGLLSCCLALNGGIHLTDPLPYSDRRDTLAETQTDGRDL